MSTEHTYTPPPSALQAQEADFYFCRLPSRPKLVARSDSSSRPWRQPLDPWPEYHQFTNIGRHESLVSFWLNSSKREELVNLLDSRSVQFTSIDPVKVIEPRRDIWSDPVITHRAMAIAVKPGTLSRKDGAEVVSECKALLERHGIYDVEFAIREASCFSGVGPKFPEPAEFPNAAVELRIPVSSTLGTAISSTNAPDATGTRGFYVASEDDPPKLYFLTCRHVVFPSSSTVEGNVEYEDPTEAGSLEPCIGVIQPPAGTLRCVKEGGLKEIKRLEDIVASYQEKAAALEGKRWQKKLKERTRWELEDHQKKLEAFKKELEALDAWGDESDRVIGHVVYSPPITTCGSAPSDHDSNDNKFILDVCVCELDPTKLGANNFMGNVVDLGGDGDPYTLFKMIGRHKLKRGINYDDMRLLKLEGFTQIDEMVNPTTTDVTDGDDYLRVGKRGGATGLTFGKANNLPSLRTYDFSSLDGTASTTKFRALEWGVFRPEPEPWGPLIREDFSVGGDSGATVFDVENRIVGLLTGGSGTRENVDIAYVMLGESIVEEIGRRWKKVNINVPRG
ncbi:hypothetical protein EST38_g8403 [Candolleomyces aberdarensis]|uniref:Serine protease n=1 Tax=Candolleomyces aberdarensis TaxID=2316362 RepID=A0A4Q2DEF7_9AGAR|nr:hypothetical protein EST38_g8403 [Candolleomyces aberdarensis]